MAGRSAIVAALAAFLAGLAFATFSDFRIFLPALLNGAVVTVEVAVFSTIICYISAFFGGIGRDSGNLIIRWISAAYIELFRGASLLVILFWFFFVLPEFGVVLSPMVAGILGVGLSFGAYGAEIVRGSIAAVPKGQLEAAAALNMSPWNCTTRIVFPQAIIVMVPGFCNLTIELLKGTALVSAVTLVDITYASVQQNQLHYRTIEIFTITLLLYYCLSQFVRFGGALLEDRSKRHLAKAL